MGHPGLVPPCINVNGRGWGRQKIFEFTRLFTPEAARDPQNDSGDTGTTKNKQNTWIKRCLKKIKVEPKIHNGGSTKALRLARAEFHKNGPS